jgi:hypothetical protein
MDTEAGLKELFLARSQHSGYTVFGRWVCVLNWWWQFLVQQQQKQTHLMLWNSTVISIKKYNKWFVCTCCYNRIV